MLVYIICFVVFCLFVGALSLGMLLGRPLKTEDEATAAIMEGIPCMSCQSACSFAGGKTNHASAECVSSKIGDIPHKEV